MPRIEGDRIGVAFDMRGCPNRCRHCWLGAPGSGSPGREGLSEAEVRRDVDRFREGMAGRSPPIEKLLVSTWFREPDLGDDYRRLYDLEAELGDGPPRRYELLSVWRLARDGSYAEWARRVGPDTCQITFFGLRRVHDWFHRRRGAFEDSLAATERLLDAGVKPRWQLFLTTEILPDLPGLLALVDELRVRERVRELGDEFRIFLHPPSPEGEARKIESLRPTATEVADLQEAILAPTRRHFGRDPVWRTEAALFSEIVAGDGDDRDGDRPEDLWFFVCGNRDVYANVGTLDPWFRLGNLGRQSVASILDAFESDAVPGLQVRRDESPARLAESWGDPEGRRVYTSREDLLSLYRARHCERIWAGRR